MTTTNESGYLLTNQQGQQVREIMQRYINEELTEQRDFADAGRLDDGSQIQKDIDYIEGLCKHFETPNGGVYLMLFHGRKSPDEHLDDWGSDGPVFGPLAHVHTTYAGHIKLGDLKTFDLLGDLHVTEDLVYYDGVYYGDWSVCTLDQLDAGQREHLTTYDEAKSHF